MAQAEIFLKPLKYSVATMSHPDNRGQQTAESFDKNKIDTDHFPRESADSSALTTQLIYFYKNETMLLTFDDNYLSGYFYRNKDDKNYNHFKKDFLNKLNVGKTSYSDILNFFGQPNARQIYPNFKYKNQSSLSYLFDYNKNSYDELNVVLGNDHIVKYVCTDHVQEATAKKPISISHCSPIR